MEPLNIIETKIVEIEVAPKAFEVGAGIAGILDAADRALSDGWQPGQDIPAIAVSAMSGLMKAISSAQGAIAEAKASVEFVTNAVNATVTPAVIRLVTR